MRQQSFPSSYAQVLVQDWNDSDHNPTKQMLERVHSQEQAYSALLETNRITYSTEFINMVASLLFITDAVFSRTL
jgi:hypothetical protein